MLKIPENELGAFRRELQARGIGAGIWPHYEKWLRYYIDYGSKYGGGEPDVEGSLRKLASKGQERNFGVRESLNGGLGVLCITELLGVGTLF